MTSRDLLNAPSPTYLETIRDLEAARLGFGAAVAGIALGALFVVWIVAMWLGAR